MHARAATAKTCPRAVSPWHPCCTRVRYTMARDSSRCTDWCCARSARRPGSELLGHGESFNGGVSSTTRLFLHLLLQVSTRRAPTVPAAQTSSPAPVTRPHPSFAPLLARTPIWQWHATVVHVPPAHARLVRALPVRAGGALGGKRGHALATHPRWGAWGAPVAPRGDACL